MSGSLLTSTVSTARATQQVVQSVQVISTQITEVTNVIVNTTVTTQINNDDLRAELDVIKAELANLATTSSIESMIVQLNSISGKITDLLDGLITN